MERKEGLLDRSWVAGVNVAELLISQVITQLIIIIVQISLMVSITLWGFKVRLAIYSCIHFHNSHARSGDNTNAIFVALICADLQRSCLQCMVDWLVGFGTRTDRYVATILA